MRLGGITLTVLGLAALVWFGWLTSPEPESRCGTDPNVVVAWTSYDSFPARPFERECRRLAAVELAKGAAVGTPLILAGIILIVVGGRRHGAQTAPIGDPSQEAPYGRRSDDGLSWWDGYRWHPIDPAPAGPPPSSP